ncbi:hypothetical protein H9Q70_010009 [Fusarium xylarioides]|nr:hypothetical protein H9Q70_010009 [Fusarium xylarioides]
MERNIFGDGSGNDLNTIAAIEFGDIGVVKVGNLACWEHAQPLLKYHAYSQHEDIHINGWPPIAVYGPDGRRLTKPLASGDVAAEGIIYTELELKAIVTNRSLLDVVSHYSRPDLLELRVDTKQKHLVVSTKDKHEHA